MPETILENFTEPTTDTRAQRVADCIEYIEHTMRPHRPFKKPDLKKLAELPVAAAENLLIYEQILRGMIRDNVSLDDDSMFFARFLNEYNLRAPFSKQTYFEQGDIIEVYDENFTQIFRNKCFFDLCSYSLEDILTVPYYVLYRRDNRVDEIMLDRARTALSIMDEIEEFGCFKHTMQEHFLSNSKVFEIQHKWISPLFSEVSGKRLAFMASLSAEEIGKSNVVGIGFVRA